MLTLNTDFMPPLLECRQFAKTEGWSLKTKLAVMLMAAAICAIVFGAACGEAATVRDKAANVCLECVGIG